MCTIQGPESPAGSPLGRNEEAEAWAQGLFVETIRSVSPSSRRHLKQNPICRRASEFPVSFSLWGQVCVVVGARGLGAHDRLIFPGLSLASLGSFKIQKIMQNA